MIAFILSRFGYVKIPVKAILELSLQAENDCKLLLKMWECFKVTIDYGRPFPIETCQLMVKTHLTVLTKQIEAQKQISKLFHSTNIFMKTKIFGD